MHRHAEHDPGEGHEHRGLGGQKRQPAEHQRQQVGERGIGVATSRFSSLRVRAVTMAKLVLHIPVPMMFMPSSPGTSQSM